MLTLTLVPQGVRGPMQEGSSDGRQTCREVGSEDVCRVSKGLGSPPQDLHLLGSLPHLHVLYNTAMIAPITVAELCIVQCVQTLGHDGKAGLQASVMANQNFVQVCV